MEGTLLCFRGCGLGRNYGADGELHVYSTRNGIYEVTLRRIHEYIPFEFHIVELCVVIS